MNALVILRNIFTEVGRVIKFGAGLQGDARKELADALVNICDKCDTAHSTVRQKLLVVKQNFDQEFNLAHAVREFAADPEARFAFKPEHLCGEIDYLLDKLKNNLDPLKYAIDVREIGMLHENLKQIGNYDLSILWQYNQFCQDIEDIANRLDDALRNKTGEAEEIKAYLRHVITRFDQELFDTVMKVRSIKSQILN